MRDALRPILSCALTVAISAAVHGQLVGTKFEKYTRFLTALILLSLLLTPMLNLFRVGGDLLREEGTDLRVEVTLPEMSYTDALLSVLQRKIEDDVRSTLLSQFGIAASEVLQVQATIDGSDPEAIRVEALSVRIRGNADSGDIEETLMERYGCESVSVIVNA